MNYMRMVRRMNLMKYARFIPVLRKKRRNRMFAVLGVGLAGGATAYGLTKAVQNGNGKKLVNKVKNAIPNINPQKMVGVS